MKTTPEDRAELLALTRSYTATLAQWRGDLSNGIATAKLHRLRHDIAKVAAATLPNLLDDLSAAEERADSTGRLLAAESARVGELTAERGVLREAIRTYSRTIDRWGMLIIAATHSEDITTPDGDGDWQLVEERLAEVPTILAERDALAAKLAEVRALHCEADNDYRRTPSCETCHGKAGVHECGCWSSEDRQMVCGHCNGDGRFESVPYPCPTVAILDRDGGAL